MEVPAYPMNRPKPVGSEDWVVGGQSSDIFKLFLRACVDGKGRVSTLYVEQGSSYWLNLDVGLY